MAITFRDLPDVNNAEFQSYIKRSPDASNELRPELQQDCDEDRDDAPPDLADRGYRPTYASFGDSGTTATVNGYGTIMRLSRYLGGEHNPSKMFGLEFPQGDEPFFVRWRAELFQKELPIPNGGFGLQIMNIDGLQRGVPKLEFLNDRWPQVTYSVKGFNVRVRLFCQKDTVIQQFTVTNRLTSAADLQFIISVDFLMHHLNYMDSENDIKLAYERGPHGYGVIVVGSKTEEGNEDRISEQVGVLVGLFRNGESEQLSLKDAEDISNQRAVEAKYSVQKSDTLELTAAFRLQFLKRDSVWKDFVLPISDVDVSGLVQSPALALDRWPFLHNDVLSRHFLRNLEHILSVCSIPLKVGVLERRQFGDHFEYNASIERNEDERVHRVTPIALTCGDFGDHVVSVPGSFFAFKYLLLMYEQLGKDGDSLAQSIRARIYDTCKGHLQWVSELNPDEAFASNFWVDGKAVEQNGETEIPADIPANMPTYILKVTEFLKVFKERKELIFVSEWLPLLVISWIQTLIKTKNHLATTWRHLSDDRDIATYRLSDHVWIWRALQSIELLIKNAEAVNRSSPHPSIRKIEQLRTYLANRRDRGDGAQPILEFTADELRKQILRRFTIENDISKKRMLSVTRSARETRFLFHSRDTVLYYGIEWGFFRDDSQQGSELWELLAQSQSQHDEDNDESQWENPLRYALAILMDLEDHQFHKNYSASEMASHAQRVLLESSSENGLFPGQIDETTKAPALFDRELFRDFYFHAGFEIPYVLLQAEVRRRQRAELKEEATKAPEHGKEAKGSEATHGPPRSSAQDRQPKHQPIRRSSVSQSPITINMVESRLEPSENRDSAAVHDGLRNIQPDGWAIQSKLNPLKRRIPYGKFVDLSNIVEMPEEWIYDYPKFLNFEPPKIEDAASILRQADGITIANFIGKKASNKDKGEFSNGDLFGDALVPMEFIVIDVPKGKKQRKKGIPEPSPDFYKGAKFRLLWSKLQTKRTAKEAKKRLIYLGPGDCRVAALCYLVSPEMEREHISQFFDRHAASTGFILDDTIAASNIWETELHLSFYQLVKGGPTTPDFSPVRAVESTTCSSLEENSFISKAAIGFRIVGDFFDRYWTCHIIENFSGIFSKSEDDGLRMFSNQGQELWYQPQEHWQQRKVLELILFERVLSKVRQSAGEIIGAIEKGATKKTDSGEKHRFGHLRFEDRSIESLQEILQILVWLKNNFASTLEIMDLWEARESTRGQERPRWTRNDEQKYRRSIKRRSALQERCIRDLKNQQAKIEFFITLVTNAQEAIRSARSLREAENIRLFTYVTVFFLPVGLASSLFGMGQIPERRVVVTMIVTAAIALFLTVILLYCILKFMNVWKYRYFKDEKSKGSEPKSDRPQTRMEALRQRLRPSKKTAEKVPVAADLETGSRLVPSLGSSP